MSRVLLGSMLFVFMAPTLMCGALWGQPARLDYADKVRLVSCEPSTGKPCFRVKLNVVDAQGNPLSVNLPPNKDLRGSLKIFLDDQEIDPFFAVSQSGSAHAVRQRIALVLVDISGSMNQTLGSGQTRFAAAQAALRQFSEGFDDNVDRVAIVPFESHGVADRFNAATFARTREEVLRQIAELPSPGPRNNTALYSAVVLGLQALQQKSKEADASNSPEMLLIIMTDGKNEVFRGDDSGLLDGSVGLQVAEDAVKKSGVQVIGIGFGDPGEIDEIALKAISSKEYMARDLVSLEQFFSVARTLLTNRVMATFASPWDDRASLEGRTLRIRATLSVPDLPRLESGDQIWSAPEISIPPFDGKCDTDELKAALPVRVSTQKWLSWMRPFLVFLGLATILLVLWLWIPRLVWPEQYIGAFPTGSKGMRWANISRGWSSSKAKAKGPVPPGFQTWRGGQQAPRAASDKTVVQPRPDFSRSRLQERPRDRKDS